MPAHPDLYDEHEALLQRPQQPLVGQQPGATRRLRLQLTFLPWIVFSLVECLFAFTDGDLQVVVWIVTIACLLLSALFFGQGYREGKISKLTLGVLCAAAAFAGCLVGLLIRDAYMEEYMRLDSGATYKHLSPTDPASSHSDATMIKFANGSYVDREQSIGYMKSNTVYCAAPVMASGNSSASVVHWAVGKGCCNAKGSFHCSEVRDSDARSGIVVDNHLTYYTNAARMAISVFGLPAGGGEFLFVKWVKDIDAYKENLVVSGITLAIAASLIHLLASVIASSMLVKAIMKQKESRR